jgi:hypothetical protein
VLYDDGVEFAIWVDMPESRDVTGLIDDVIRALNAQQDDPVDHIRCSATDCQFYSWEFERLPVDTTVAQVPQPGVVFAVRSGRVDDFGGGTTAMGLGLRSVLFTDETYGPRLRRFLRGPDAGRVAAPVLRYDAFVSYSALDGLFAASLVRELHSQGVDCFVAAISLSAGTLWADELRTALVSSRTGVLLLTPHSAQSAWVQAEVGAMWALRLPIVPVLVDLEPDEVPSSLAAFLPRAVLAPNEPTEITRAQAIAGQLRPILRRGRDGQPVP